MGAAQAIFHLLAEQFIPSLFLLLQGCQSLRTLSVHRRNTIHVLVLELLEVLILVWHLDLDVLNGHFEITLVDSLEVSQVFVGGTGAVGCLLLQFDLRGVHHLLRLREHATTSGAHRNSIRSSEVVMA